MFQGKVFGGRSNSSSSSAWGGISGDIGDQTDLAAALADKTEYASAGTQNFLPRLDANGDFVDSAISDDGTTVLFARKAQINSSAIGNVPLTVNGFSGQTANLTDWKVNGGAALLSVNSAGVLVGASSSISLVGSNMRLTRGGQHIDWDGASFTTSIGNAYDLGTAALKWKSVYVGTGIYTPQITVAKTTAYPVVANDSNVLFTNEGATGSVTFTLPTAAAGLQYSFFVQDADGITITAAAGDTIRMEATVTAAAGSISSTTIGSLITLKAINAVEWVATSIQGTWA